MNEYRYCAKYSSYSHTFRVVRRVVAAVLLLTFAALVSDKAIAIYKGIIGCVVTVAFIGVIGGVELGYLPLAFGFLLAL